MSEETIDPTTLDKMEETLDNLEAYLKAFPPAQQRKAFKKFWRKQGTKKPIKPKPIRGAGQ